MTKDGWRHLIVTSITDPAQAARRLLSLDLPREALWTGLGLVAVLNTLLYSATNTLIPGPSPLPALFDVPVVYGAVVALGLTLSVYAIFWVGRAMGGLGSLFDIMAVIVWLQGLRFLVQMVALGLMFIAPLLTTLLVFVASLYGFYMVLHFINQAHQLNSIGRTAGVIVLSILAIVLGMSVLISLIGGPIVGAAAYV